MFDHRRVVVALALIATAAPQSWLYAQASLGVQAMALATHGGPAPGGVQVSEVRLVQPMILAQISLAGGRVRTVGMFNLEGLTLSGGEFAPGTYGEGFVHRRHPHTYVHELAVTAMDLLGQRDGRASLSVTAGKGVVPFGTEDPSGRPILRFPVNHHLAQVLERAIVATTFRSGALLIEAAAFNGDEPERPGQWPSVGRVGDSWAVRGGSASRRTRRYKFHTRRSGRRSIAGERAPISTNGAPRSDGRTSAPQALVTS